MCLLACSSAVGAAILKDPILSIEGIWVPESTIRKLHESMSPHASNPEMIIIAVSDETRWRFSWVNYHEATWRYILNYKKRPKGAILRFSPYERYSTERSDGDELAIQIKTDTAGRAVSLKFMDYPAISHLDESFVRIPDELHRYSSKLLLVGVWQDKDNRLFNFSMDGIAKWPDETFNYTISMDGSEADCDYITTPASKEPGGSRRIGFSRKGNSLMIYRIRYDKDTPISCDTQPLYILNKAKGN